MEELIQSLNLEEFDYYYHITGKGYGTDIIENGLYLEQCDLKTTTILLPHEFINNPEEYCSKEYVDSIVKRNEMVIISCPKEEGNNIIIETDSKWIGDQELKYLIRSENILGYIDLETLDIIYNQDYIDFNFRR